MKMQRRLLLLTAALAPHVGARAQPPDIVVTGRGLSAPAGDAVFDIVEIGRDRLANSASNRLEDVLRDVPGFQLFRRSDSRSANPTSQGATLRALGGNASSRVLLILDGVPQTDPFGGWAPPGSFAAAAPAPADPARSPARSNSRAPLRRMRAAPLPARPMAAATLSTLMPASARAPAEASSR